MSAPTIKRCEGIKRNCMAHSAHRKHPANKPVSAAPTGRIFPAGTKLMISREFAKALSEDTGNEYLLATGMCGKPQITSIRTGKVWAINWDDLIDMAVTAGIDEEN